MIDCKKIPERENISPYQLLANAIVEQAAKDYKMALKHKDEQEIESIERFFRSDWYKVLTDVDGEWLIAELRKVYG